MKSNIIRVLLLAAGAFLAVCGAAVAQGNYPDENKYLIQPEDILEIKVWPLDDFSMEVKVRPDGMISYPVYFDRHDYDDIRNSDPQGKGIEVDKLIGLLNDPDIYTVLNNPEIRVEGMTVRNLTQIMLLKLLPLANDPKVAINVTNFKRMRVFILGAVKNPGVYEMRKGDTVLDIITSAGGFDEKAKKSKVALIRPPSDLATPLLKTEGDVPFDPADNITFVNVAEILGKADFPPSQSYLVSDGDIIFVPKGKKIDWKKLYGVVTSLYTTFQIENLID